MHRISRLVLAGSRKQDHDISQSKAQTRVLRTCSLRACGGLVSLCAFCSEKQDQLLGQLVSFSSVQEQDHDISQSKAQTRVLRTCSLRACGGLVSLCAFRSEKQDQLLGQLVSFSSVQEQDHDISQSKAQTRVLRTCSLRACGGFVSLCAFRSEKQDQLLGRLAFLVSLQTSKAVASK